MHFDRKTSKSQVYLAFLLTLVLFISLLLLVKPMLNSDDDFYVLYTVSGGYGNQPSAILHYNYGWNPILYAPIAFLFRHFHFFNWYSFFLVLLQFFSCGFLVYAFVRFYQKKAALLLTILYFLFFQSPYLLSLNNSNTSFSLSIAGCSLLLFYFLKENWVDKGLIYVGGILLFVSGLLRLHAFGLCSLLSLCTAIILLPRKELKTFCITLLLPGLLVLIFTLGQSIYHYNVIRGYGKEEKLRQSLFYIANHPPVTNARDTGTLKIKNSFIKEWFLYDDSFTTQKDVDNFIRQFTSNRILNTKENSAILYWLLINTRVYSLLIFVILLIFILSSNFINFRKWLMVLAVYLIIFFSLLLFFKLTSGIFTAIIAMLFLSALTCLDLDLLVTNKKYPVVLVLAIIGIIWMLVRIKKTNDLNVSNIQETEGLLKEISSHRDSLFIHTNEFNDNGYYIWNYPAKYPLPNLITKELLFTNSYHTTMERFHVCCLPAAFINRNNVFLAGTGTPLIKDYFGSKGQAVVEHEVPGFRYLHVIQFKPQ